jgi:hypothetical protein
VIRILAAFLCFGIGLHAATLQAGPGQTYLTPCAAIQKAQAGDRIEVSAGTYAGKDAPCRITTPDLYIVGVNGRVLINARDSRNYAWNVYGQGIWLLDLPSGGLTVENFDFIGAAIALADGNNAAGMRVQAGDLTCISCGFYFNQNGVLAAAPGAHIRFTRSQFAWNGTGKGTEHNIYVSTGAAELIFEYSVSRNSPTGQDIKSRAAKTTILYSLIGESAAAADGNSNFEVSTPNGGELTIIGSVLLQNPSTTNAHIITTGEEGVTHALTKTTILHCTVVGYRTSNTFVRNSNVSDAASFAGEVIVRNNLFVGPGVLFEGKQPTDAGGNYQAKTLAAALFASATDYRLQATSPGATIGAALDGTLVPLQPVIPFGAEPRTTWTAAGAYALGSTAAAMAIPAIAYARPAAVAGYEKTSGTGVVVTVPTGPVVAVPPVVTVIPLDTGAPSAMRSQRVNQPAALQPDGSWSFGRAGAMNVQVWRNGLLLQENAHYTLDMGKGTITPVGAAWPAGDVVVLAYLL